MRAADAALASVNARRWPTEQITYDYIVATIHALLDDAAWEAAYTEGRAMALDQAIALALSQAGET